MMWALVITFCGAAVIGYLAGCLISVFHMLKLRRELASMREQINLLVKNQSCLPQRLIELAKRGAQK